MSELRHLFSAQSAKPKVEASLRALIRAAVYLASADGEIQPAELEVLIDSLRAVLTKRVGPEHLEEYSKVPFLLDEARVAVRELASQGERALLTRIAAALEGDFRKDAIALAREVVLANGTVTDAERTSLDKLAAAVGLDLDVRPS